MFKATRGQKCSQHNHQPIPDLCWICLYQNTLSCVCVLCLKSPFQRRKRSSFSTIGCTWSLLNNWYNQCILAMRMYFLSRNFHGQKLGSWRTAISTHCSIYIYIELHGGCKLIQGERSACRLHRAIEHSRVQAQLICRQHPVYRHSSYLLILTRRGPGTLFQILVHKWQQAGCNNNT